MPNIEATKKAEARRKAREAKQETAARQARADVERLPSDTAKARLAAVDNKDAGQKAAVNPDADNAMKIATDTPGIVTHGPAPTGRVSGAPVSKTEQRARQKRITQLAAQEQAKRDALRSPEPPEDNYKPGDIIPLHVLNARAKRDRIAARDEVVAIAREIGQFAHSRIEGRAPRSIPDRSRRTRDAMDAMNRAKEAADKKD